MAGRSVDLRPARPAGVHTLVRVPSGGHVSSLTNPAALTTVALAADKLYFFPYFPARDVLIDQLLIEVTTLFAGLAHVGIYDSDSLDAPRTLLETNDAALDVSTTGDKSSEVFAAILARRNQLYWWAVTSNGTPTLRAIGAGSAMSVGSDGNTPYGHLRADRVFAALPGTAPSASMVGGNMAPVFVRGRVD